ncbi:MAG: hypothetical protein WC223_13090 [Bacteroidales bacterium]|jgi:hypothetical protein
MKTTLLTKENRQQMVFTPETEFEKDILKMFHSEITNPIPFDPENLSKVELSTNAKIYLGGFYDCAGGWTRENKSEDSLIVVFDKI